MALNGGILENTPKLVEVAKAVCVEFRVSADELKCQWRARRVFYPRAIFCLTARELTLRTYPEIGMFLGDRDHSTIINACRRAQRLVADDKAYAEHYRAIMRKFGRLV